MSIRFLTRTTKIASNRLHLWTILNFDNKIVCASSVESNLLQTQGNFHWEEINCYVAYRSCLVKSHFEDASKRDNFQPLFVYNVYKAEDDFLESVNFCINLNERLNDSHIRDHELFVEWIWSLINYAKIGLSEKVHLITGQSWAPWHSIPSKVLCGLSNLRWRNPIAIAKRLDTVPWPIYCD